MRIELSDYNREWPLQFSEEASRLKKNLPFPNLRIEHIGSTAVPGLSAKPVIDILIGVEQEIQLDSIREHLLKHPYYFYIQYFEKVMPFRRFFIKTDNIQNVSSIPAVITDDSWKNIGHDIRSCHIHCVSANHSFFDKHLKFRDILRSDQKVRSDYEALKKQLTTQQWESGAEYAEAKSGFISGILEK